MPNPDFNLNKMPIRAFFEPRHAPLTQVAIPGGLAGNGITVTGPVLERLSKWGIRSNVKTIPG